MIAELRKLFCVGLLWGIYLLWPHDDKDTRMLRILGELTEEMAK